MKWTNRYEILLQPFEMQKDFLRVSFVMVNLDCSRDSRNRPRRRMGGRAHRSRGLVHLG
jgi:hypothetical protein